MAAHPLTFVLVGHTGNGKSTLARIISGSDQFKVGHGLSSETRHCQSVTGSWLGIAGQPVVTVADTPGTSDSGGAEQEQANMKNMVSFLRNVRAGVHCFAIVLNGTHIRFDANIQAVLAFLEKMLSPELWKYAVIVFTHCDPAGRSLWESKVNIARSTGRDGIMAAIRARFPHVTHDIPVLTSSSEYAVQELQERFAPLLQFMQSKRAAPYTCGNIQEVDRIVRQNPTATNDDIVKALREQLNVLQQEINRLRAELENARNSGGPC